MTATAAERTYPGNPLRIHANPAERAAILREYRKLLDWLEDNPGAPLPKWGHELQVSCRSSAQVRAYAAGLGITAESPAHATRAVKRFGPVAYVLYASNASEGS